MSQEKDNNKEKSSSSFFSKMKSWVVEEVPDTNDQPSKKETVVDTITATAPIPSSFNYSTNPNPLQNNGVFDSNFYNELQVILDKNNLEGYDYLEFAKIRKRQETIPNLSEPQKYQMAYESIQAMAQVSNQNVAKEHFVTTADHYIDVLNKEEVEFNTEMAKEMTNQVQSRLNSAQEKQQTIVSKTEQIAKLNAEIAELNMSINQDTIEAQQMKDKIEATGKNFKVTIDIVKGEIERDKLNINTYIK